MTLVVGGHCQRVGAVVVCRRRVRDVCSERRIDLCDCAGQRHGGTAVVGDRGVAARRSQRAMRYRERHGYVVASRIDVRNAQSSDKLRRVFIHRQCARHRVNRPIIDSIDGNRDCVSIGQRTPIAVVALVIGGHRQRVAAVVVRGRRIRDVRSERRIDLRYRPGERERGGAIACENSAAANGCGGYGSVAYRKRNGQFACRGINVRDT